MFDRVSRYPGFVEVSLKADLRDEAMGRIFAFKRLYCTIIRMFSLLTGKHQVSEIGHKIHIFIEKTRI